LGGRHGSVLRALGTGPGTVFRIVVSILPSVAARDVRFTAAAVTVPTPNAPRSVHPRCDQHAQKWWETTFKHNVCEIVTPRSNYGYARLGCPTCLRVGRCRRVSAKARHDFYPSSRSLLRGVTTGRRGSTMRKRVRVAARSRGEHPDAAPELRAAQAQKGVVAIAGWRPISVRWRLVRARRWTIAGWRAIAGSAISVRRRHVAAWWRTPLRGWPISRRQPVSVRRQHIARWWRSVPASG
jgi:hypothetical protein